MEVLEEGLHMMLGESSSNSKYSLLTFSVWGPLALCFVCLILVLDN